MANASAALCRTLDHLIPRHGMRLPELLRIAVQIAEGLEAAHGAGITRWFTTKAVPSAGSR